MKVEEHKVVDVIEIEFPAILHSHILCINYRALGINLTRKNIPSSKIFTAIFVENAGFR